jgi:hypothetical protein
MKSTGIDWDEWNWGDDLDDDGSWHLIKKIRQEVAEVVLAQVVKDIEELPLSAPLMTKLEHPKSNLTEPTILLNLIGESDVVAKLPISKVTPIIYSERQRADIIKALEELIERVRDAEC